MKVSKYKEAVALISNYKFSEILRNVAGYDDQPEIQLLLCEINVDYLKALMYVGDTTQALPALKKQVVTALEGRLESIPRITIGKNTL